MKTALIGRSGPARSGPAQILLYLVFFLFVSTSSAFGQKYKIKFATLAPEGSSWMDVMHEFDNALRAESEGRLGIRFYPGGVSGDEKDMLRKMRLGQLHSAGFTGIGLGEVLPDVRIFDTPFLFKNYDEVDTLHTQFQERFARGFEEKGFVMIGWADVGFVYVFSNTPAQRLADVRRIKMWMWEGDPVAGATFRALKINPVPLSIVDVLTSLQTGMVDGFYISPLGAIALQWFTRVKYMLDLPMTDPVGAALVTKKFYNKLPEDLQETLLRNGRRYLRKLVEVNRSEHVRSVETLKAQGIQILPPPGEEEARAFYVAGDEARRQLAGKLYSPELLAEVEAALTAYRARNANSSTN